MSDKWNEPQRDLARIKSADIGDVYNGMLGLIVEFQYDGGATHQNLAGYMLEASMVVRFMVAVGVDRLSRAVGRSCWVTHTHDKILRIEGLHADDKRRPFDIPEWQEWVKRRLPALSWHELETGEDPNERKASAREILGADMRVSDSELAFMLDSGLHEWTPELLALDLRDSRAEVAALQARLELARKALRAGNVMADHRLPDGLTPYLAIEFRGEPAHAVAALLASNPEGK